MTYVVMMYCWTDLVWFVEARGLTHSAAAMMARDLRVNNDRVYIEPE